MSCEVSYPEIPILYSVQLSFPLHLGTMGNLIGVLSHCRSRGEEVLLGHKCHLLLYEQGGVAQIGGVHPRAVWNQKDGTMNMDDLAGAIRDDDPHYPRFEFTCSSCTEVSY